MNKEYLKWLNGDFLTKEDKDILSNMTDEEINESFSEDLSFGTSGIRGIMGLGNSKINRYTIGKITLGLANYINKHYRNGSVVIGYDTRNNSREFAFTTACILNKNGIKTYISKDISSTPLISYSVNYLKANFGIVITASHNPKEYNGYKVYDSTGSAITSPVDKEILKEINLIKDYSLIEEESVSNKLFNYIDKEVVDNFNKENEKVIINKEIVNNYANKIKLTYTSFHGTGIRVIPFILEKYGIRYNLVNEQCKIDSDFTYAPKPNPEIEDNYVLGRKYALELGSDAIIASDPDSDRFAFLYKDGDYYVPASGNLIGCIFLYYLLNNTKVVENNYVVKSVVSTPLYDKIASYYNAKVKTCLTGCKNIVKLKMEDKENFLFGFEESLGYIFNIDVNDKNAFSSTIFFIEILSYLKERDITIKDYIDEIYEKFGYYLNKQISFEFDKKEDIDKLMSNLRDNNIFNEKEKIDYLDNKNLKTNLLKFVIDDNSYFMVRPSGTEPKVKLYFYVNDKDEIRANKRLNNLIDMVLEKIK